jgi:sugar-specific transcriptional regulator TrmB
MNDYSHALQQIGLTELESKVYLFVLKHGPCSATQVYKELKHDKSSTYRILEELVSKRLLISLGETYGQQFMVSDIHELDAKVKEQKKGLEVAEDTISSLITELSTNSAENYKNHNITIYEGPESYVKLMEKRLEIGSSPIREISNAKILPEVNKNYWEYVEQHIKRRIRKKVFLQALVRSSESEIKYEQTDAKLLKEVRYLPDSFKINSTIATAGDYTLIDNKYRDRLLGIVIKDKLVTELINSMFDFIWEAQQDS